MTVRLTLVCHSFTTALTRAAFPADEPLTERGLRETAAATPPLHRAATAYSSPAPACTQTATALGLTAHTDPALRDCDFGRWRGRTLNDVEQDEPDAINTWLTDPAANPHGGESILDVLTRAGHWLTQRAHHHSHQIAVTHPAIIRAALIHALNAPPTTFWRIDVPPLARITLTGQNTTWTLRLPT